MGERSGLQYSIRGHGEPIVLLHSLGATHRIFDALVPTLEFQHTVIAVDLPGHGKSPCLDSRPALGGYVDSLTAFLLALRIEAAHLVGQSIGGMIALEFACRNPDWPGTVVALDSIGYTSPAWDERYRARAELVEQAGVGAVAFGVAERSLGPSTKAAHPELTAWYAAMLAETYAAGYAWACRAMCNFDLRDRLRRVRIPTLLAAGDEDELTTPAQAGELRTSIRGATVAVIERCGHVPCLERPAETAQLIADWARRYPLRSVQAVAD